MLKEMRVEKNNLYFMCRIDFVAGYMADNEV